MVAYVHACSVGTVATRFLCPWDFPGQNTGVGCHYFSSGDLPNPGFEPRSPTLQADSLPTELSGIIRVDEPIFGVAVKGEKLSEGICLLSSGWSNIKH